MKAATNLYLIILISLLLSCVNTRKNADKIEQSISTAEDVTSQEKLVESTTAKLEDQYLSNEIYLAIKPDSGVTLSMDADKKEAESFTQLGGFAESFVILNIHQPLLALKPNVYRITFEKGTDLAAAIETLESLSFVQYAELIPLNK